MQDKIILFDYFNQCILKWEYESQDFEKIDILKTCYSFNHGRKGIIFINNNDSMGFYFNKEDNSLCKFNKNIDIIKKFCFCQKKKEFFIKWDSLLTNKSFIELMNRGGCNEGTSALYSLEYLLHRMK